MIGDQVPKLPGLEVLGPIARGGMSTVWKAWDAANSRLVAVKVLSRAQAPGNEALRRFEQEAETMREIRHPGIVAAYDFAVFGGVPYLTLEYVDGYSFGELLKRKCHVGEEDCLLICESVALALDYAWNDHGIVHCDIKPDNLMINSEGVVKLTDLGICHRFEYLEGLQAVPEHITGTPAYISPEQIYADLELDCRTDIYSLGATLYHLATGRVLFPDLDNEATLRSHCAETAQARDPRLYRPRLSAGFACLLEAMLVKNRDGRLQSWREVYAQCRAVEAGETPTVRAATCVSSVALV